MRILLHFAFRNLLRQRRRAVLLGSAMALGTCFLVLASSFVEGISQTLFDRVMTYVAGHASLIVCDRGYMYRSALRGEASLKDKIRRIPNVRKVDETIGVMCRLVGGAKGDNAILVGLDMRDGLSEAERREIQDNFPMAEGSFDDLRRKDVENPAILSRNKAAYLKLDKGDVFSARFQDSRGRMQVGKFTLVGIFQPSNAFMEAPFFVGMDRVKSLMDMDSTDLPYLYLTVTDPRRNAKAVADSIYRLVQPEVATLPVSVRHGGVEASLTAFGIKSDSAARRRMRALTSSDIDWKGRVVALPSGQAARFGVKLGDTVELVAGLARTGDTLRELAQVAGIWDGAGPDRSVVLWEEDVFQAARSFRQGKAPVEDAALRSLVVASLDTLVSPTWKLLPRVDSTNQVRDQMRQVGARSWKSPVVAVRTMYETGQQILQLADALNLVTLVAVLVLFVVVLTGVVNTLRMTVRERTREIGTLRSLGMQARQVQILFLMEAGLLAIGSAAVGTGLALLSMLLLSRWTFPIEGNPLSMLLVRGHLVFVPQLSTTVGHILLVTGMALVAAWNPARRAAGLAPATALRHHE